MTQNHSFWGLGILFHLISTVLKKIIQIGRCYGPVSRKSTEMCPVSAPVKIFSFWHYIPLDNDWSDHSCQFWLPNPCMRHATAHQKKNFCHQFTSKPLIAEILKRHLLVAKKVPYNSQMTLHEIVDPSCHKWTTYVSAPQWPLTRTAIARRTVNVEFFQISIEPS